MVPEVQATNTYQINKIVDVVTAWPIIKNSMAFSFPQGAPVTEQTYTNLQNSLICGNMVAWGILKNGDIAGVMTTAVVEDTLAGFKYLYVYTMYMLLTGDDEGWPSIFKQLRKIAKTYGCYKIMTRPSNPRIVQVLEPYATITPYWLAEMEA